MIGMLCTVFGLLNAQQYLSPMHTKSIVLHYQTEHQMDHNVTTAHEWQVIDMAFISHVIWNGAGCLVVLMSLLMRMFGGGKYTMTDDNAKTLLMHVVLIVGLVMYAVANLLAVYNMQSFTAFWVDATILQSIGGGFTTWGAFTIVLGYIYDTADWSDKNLTRRVYVIYLVSAPFLYAPLFAYFVTSTPSTFNYVYMAVGFGAIGLALLWTGVTIDTLARVCSSKCLRGALPSSKEAEKNAKEYCGSRFKGDGIGISDMCNVSATALTSLVFHTTSIVFPAFITHGNFSDNPLDLNHHLFTNGDEAYVMRTISMCFSFGAFAGVVCYMVFGVIPWKWTKDLSYYYREAVAPVFYTLALIMAGVWLKEVRGAALLSHETIFCYAFFNGVFIGGAYWGGFMGNLFRKVQEKQEKNTSVRELYVREYELEFNEMLLLVQLVLSILALGFVRFSMHYFGGLYDAHNVSFIDFNYVYTNIVVFAAASLALSLFSVGYAAYFGGSKVQAGGSGKD